MRLIVTRPPAQAAAWVAELQALGQDAQALPLIDIGPPADVAPVAAAWHALADDALVMFVSANAVAQFFAHRPPAAAWPPALQAGATGPGTVAALHAAGLAPAQMVAPPDDAPSFDSEALWAELQGRDWAGRRVLVVRGEDGRDWLADTLRSRGAQVRFVAAYRRIAPRPDTAQLALLAAAQAAPAQHLWLFSSSEAVAHLCALVPRADWSRSQAVASHARIAQAARDAGFAAVALAPPRAAAVAALVAQWPSIQSAAL